jgi:hypothetical protein
VILVRFTLMTGHQHPNLETGRSNYVKALREWGRTETEIDAPLNAIVEEARAPAMTLAVSRRTAWLCHQIIAVL